MIKRKDNKVFLYTEIEPKNLNSVLEINIDDKTCVVDTVEGSFVVDWSEYLEEIEMSVKESIDEVKQKIINNKNVIHSYETLGNQQQVEKNKRFLQRNIELLERLKTYVI
jgi:hypothetical protein